MIDHLMTFASEAAAKADAVVGQYWISDGQGHAAWRGDCCIPNVFVWAPASNTTVTGVDGNGNPITSTVRHAYDSNWRIIISKPVKDAALAASANCHLVADRDAAARGLPFVLQTVLTDAQLNALAIEPTFAGSAYPFGQAH